MIEAKHDDTAHKPSSKFGTENTSYDQLIDIWLRSTRSQRETTKQAYRNTLFDFAEFVTYKPLVEVSRKDIVAFRDSVLLAGASPVTANSKVGILRTIFRGAQDYEVISSNPAIDIRTNAPHIGKARIPFSTDDLRKIFSSSLYVSQYRPVSGGKEAAYWLPLLALFTGARVEELAQLLVSDVREISGLGHYINISDDAKHAHLKNASSRRRVPIHEALIACGFLDYVARQKKTEMLFGDLKPNHRGKFAGYFSYFFSNYLRHKIGIVDERKVFHSFRHTFKEICRKVGIEEAVHDALTGHSKPSAGRKYGNEQYPFEPLFEAMAKFEVSDLDLSHLYVRPVANRLLRSEIKPVSAFYGLVVAYAATKNKQSVAPYVIVIHEGRDSGVALLDNHLIYGYLPQGKLLLTNAWIEIHKEELLANWHSGRLTGEYFKVEPLR